MTAITIPRGSLGSAQITANVVASTVATDVPGLSVTVTAGGRPLLVLLSTTLQNSVDGQYTNANLIMDGTQIQNAGAYSPATDGNMPVTISQVVTPSAGSHTFTVQLSNQAGATGSIQAGATYPTTLTVIEI